MLNKKSIIAVFIIFLIGIGGYIFAYYQTLQDVEITVTNTERIVESDGDGKTSSKYLVFTKDETFENTDAFFLGKFNSSDVQGSLQKDSTYTVEVLGWRVPFMSMYRNVIKIK